MKLTISFLLLVLAVSCYGQDSETSDDKDVDYADLYDVTEGDILVPKVHGKVAMRTTTRRFPNGVVPYTFQQGYPAQWRKYIQELVFDRLMNDIFRTKHPSSHESH